jgi:hypothetical protein
MHAAQLSLRVAEHLTKDDGIVEIGFIGRFADACKHGQAGEEIVEGFGVGHLNILSSVLATEKLEQMIIELIQWTGSIQMQLKKSID